MRLIDKVNKAKEENKKWTAKGTPKISGKVIVLKEDKGPCATKGNTKISGRVVPIINRAKFIIWLNRNPNQYSLLLNKGLILNALEQNLLYAFKKPIFLGIWDLPHFGQLKALSEIDEPQLGQIIKTIISH